MIGDNPETDISGANQAGRPWSSVLTRSGLFKGTNDQTHPGDHVIDDVGELLEIIDEFEASHKGA